MEKFDFEVNYDVAVVGGGIAGVAAAIQAARSGMKTVMLEKTVFAGGLATTGLVFVYLPLCDGNGHQVQAGLTYELMEESLKYGPGDIPDNWQDMTSAKEHERLRCIFSPASYILSLDALLEKSGVDIWYDTLVCGAEYDDKRVNAVICENKSGRGKITAKCFIDASGDCELARKCNIPCHDEYNYLSVWAIERDDRIDNDFFGNKMRMMMDGVDWDVEKAPPGTVYRGISGKIVSDFILKSRKMLRDRYEREYAAGTADRKSLYPVTLPSMPQFRKIYSLDAVYVLTTGENNKHFDDSIGLVADWRKSGPVWEIPYRTLIPANGFGGYLAAGRCTGSSGDAWEVTRVIPPAALTGQAAGVAAVLSIKLGIEPAALDYKLVQDAMRELGNPIHLEDAGL